ncbi:anthranilate phosphoribosyltransferase family protein [Phormidium sp. CCY1219]|uniref:anthranilate phosphoribosyltransferase family protein n=1 Tax=Phormidium sp. CCY1219 TaxID=2886104 RepID=UPI002D1EC0DE|nr:anthranilate phosphoribosyltransferase family protein [Phormidium sp. CCY1219]MEB3826564.1 anthranilate phosphoribosyltransferase family protein [Phormidium sp. CCY1219]
MSYNFRPFIQKVGSGSHTGKNLSREEAASAMAMMLSGEATPAQIGAFLIAHRIQRPQGEELAGFLDACDRFAQKLPAIDRPVTVLGCPYDGRSRTAPVTAISALGLAVQGVPTLCHGSDRMPTKYGMPFIEVWRGLGLDWTVLSRDRLAETLARHGLSFYYQPHWFGAAESLVPYRDQLGKRPPVATMELMWNPYAGDTHLVCGFVHPPTEGLFQTALSLRQQTCFTTVKGLEGSCDLPRTRPAIIGQLGKPGASCKSPSWQRLHLHPREYDLGGKDVALESVAAYLEDLRGTLAGENTPLTPAAIWNLGFYLWRCGVCSSLEAGLKLGEEMLLQGQLMEKVRELQDELS